jgi:hypothetical protein
LLAHGRWFFPGTPASSTTKTGRHDIAEILLKVAIKINNKAISYDSTVPMNTILLRVEQKSEVYSIQYFFTKNRPNTDRIQHVEDVVIKFVVSDMRQIGGFLRVSIFIN